MIRRVAIAAVCAMMWPAPPATAQTAPEWRAPADDLLAQGRWVQAADAYRAGLGSHPNDLEARYGLVVALAQSGEPDAAVEALVAAIGSGFVDFHRLLRDSRLAPIRDRPQYRAILAGWRELLDARAERNEAALRRLFGAGHVVERDARLRLIYSSAWRTESLALARREIDAVAGWAFGTLFDEPDPGDPHPDPWVSVILPTPERFTQMMMALGAGANVGGIYDQDRLQLIGRDIGPSLRHEFLHVLHWRLLARTGQRHPDWIMEGLGALVEDLDPDPDAPGGVRPAPSWRTNIAKQLMKVGALPRLDELAAMDRETFRTRRPNANYAVARAVMLFLDQRGELAPFFRRCVESYDADPSGLAALRDATGLGGPALDEAFRAWLADLPEAPEELAPGMASLGVTVGAGRGDGPVIEEIPPGSPARGAGLRLGDVILAVDGRSTRTILDLVRVLSQRSPGQAVTVTARRGRRVLDARVTLVEFDGG